MANNDLGRYAAQQQRARKTKKSDRKRKRKEAFRLAGGKAAVRPPRDHRGIPERELRGLYGRPALGRTTRGIVTVLMSAYRAHRWIGEAAESILSQKLPWGWRLELLIGVDACPATKKAALAIRDPRVVVVEMAENVGTYQTLNALLDHAQGSLIAVMDSDDVSRPGRLNAGIVALLENPKLGVVAGHYRNCDAELRPTAPPTKKVCHGAMMVRRAVYDRLGGYKPWRCGADWDFFTRVEKSKYETRLQDKTFLLRRVHPSSLCQSAATRPKSPAREFAFAEIEKEKGRKALTVVARSAPAHRVVRDLRPEFKTGVGVVMPTIPARAKTAAAVVRTMLAQGVQKIHVHLNGYQRVPPWAQHSRVRAFLHSASTGPIVRFFDLPDCKYILSVDDDIVYPGDYVRRTVAHLVEAGPRTAFSYHASAWRPDAAPEYQERHTFTYEEGMETAKRVPYGGSGVAAFHARDLWFVEAEAAPPGFSMEDDVWISAGLARTGVKLVRPRSTAQWIKPTPVGAQGLYTKAKANGFRRRDAAIAAALGMGVWKVGNSSKAPKGKPPALDERRFWGQRYRQTGNSILTVGRRDATAQRNEAEYAKAIAQFQAMVRRDFPDPSAISVLDVGYGLGHYAEALAELGVRKYVGIDFASAAAPPGLVRRGFKFRQGTDASEPGLDLGQTFDLVVVIDVIFHIVDDSRFAQAVANLKRHASGLLYITGLFQDRKLAAHVRHRAPSRFQMGAPVSVDKWRDNKIARFNVG